MIACSGINLFAQQKTHDSIAIALLERMSNIIGSLQSCRFTVDVEIDVVHETHGLLKRFDHAEVLMSGTNKLLIDARGYKGHRMLFYNGKQLAYYSFGEHHYGIIPAPASTIKTIDSVYEQYDIEFPAADFFYPAFVEDLLMYTDSLRFLGIEEIEGKPYFHCIAHAPGVSFQIWAGSDPYALPEKYAIHYRSLPGAPQYVATFGSWEINPSLSDALFEFTAPPGARRVTISSKNELQNKQR